MSSNNVARRSFLQATALGFAACALPAGSSYAKRIAASGKKPNILLIMADDMGYSDLGCYGGEIETPNLDTLASQGVRFTQHYSTGRCWPSRASILTGYYAQQVRRDNLPGIQWEESKRPDWAPLLPRMIGQCGYRSYHSGKWHIDGAPEAEGFERSWGRHKHGCDWDRFFDSEQWKEGNYSAPVERGQPYYSTVAIADHAIACMKLHQEDHADKPFFQYVAFYAPHFPLHAMQEDIAPYHDVYKVGWDVIRERRHERMRKMGLVNCKLSNMDKETVSHWSLSDNELQDIYGDGEVSHAVPWESLTEKQKEFQASKMAVHAAMITRMDHEIGRLIDQLKEMGEYENTLILVVSDNGASAEYVHRGDGHDKEAQMGSAQSYACLGPGWSTAANTPFRLHKSWNHEGGIASPLIAHWPRGITAQGDLRHDPTHFIDIVPTVLDLAGCEGKDDRPGLSLAPAFEKDGAIHHEYLWWSHDKNQAIRMGDWKLVMGRGRTGLKWELFNLQNDRSESTDLAGEYPEKVEQLKQKWNDVAHGFVERLKE